MAVFIFASHVIFEVQTEITGKKPEIWLPELFRWSHYLHEVILVDLFPFYGMKILNIRAGL